MLPIVRVREIIRRMADAVTDTRPLVVEHVAGHPEFRPVGEAMLAGWNDGVAGMAV
jgi:hypothetical protein